MVVFVVVFVVVVAVGVSVGVSVGVVFVVAVGVSVAVGVAVGVGVSVGVGVAVMTDTERLAFQDYLLESLDAVHAYDIEREMLSAVLLPDDDREDEAILSSAMALDAYLVERQMRKAIWAICHAQQLEINTLRRNYALAKADLARYTSSQVR